MTAPVVRIFIYIQAYIYIQKYIYARRGTSHCLAECFWLTDIHSSAHRENFRLLYAGDDTHHLVPRPICSSMSIRFAGTVLLPSPVAAWPTCCTRPPTFPRKKNIAENDRQLIPFAGVADLDQGALQAPPLVPLGAVLSDPPAPSLLPHDTDAHDFTAPDLVSTHYMGAGQPPPPQRLYPFVRHLRGETAPTREESAASSAPPPTDCPPSPAVLERLSTDQRTSNPHVRNRLPSHRREIVF